MLMSGLTNVPPEVKPAECVHDPVSFNTAFCIVPLPVFEPDWASTVTLLPKVPALQVNGPLRKSVWAVSAEIVALLLPRVSPLIKGLVSNRSVPAFVMETSSTEVGTICGDQVVLSDQSPVPPTN